MSIGYGSGGYIENKPRYLPARKPSINIVPAGLAGSKSVQCLRCLGSGSVTPPSPKGDLVLIVEGMPQLSAFVGRQKPVRSSPHSSRGSALTEQSTSPDSPEIRSRPPPVLPRPR